MWRVKFESIYLKKIWGGRQMETLGRVLPDGDIGESWEISATAQMTNPISDGPLKGKLLRDVVADEGEKLLGSRFRGSEFPLLVKMIDAKEPLSIQVHPAGPDSRGKDEAWYIVDAEPGAYVTVGLQEGCSMAMLKDAFSQGGVEKCLRQVPIKQGDVLYVPGGLIHGIGGQSLILEIQQNCDITYRMYDYGRQRELQLAEGMTAMVPAAVPLCNHGTAISHRGYRETIFDTGAYFTLRLYEVKAWFSETFGENEFRIYTCVGGQGEVSCDGEWEPFRRGESILIPAFVEQIHMRGAMTVLRTHIP